MILAILVMFLLFTVLDSSVEYMTIHSCQTCLQQLLLNQPSYYVFIQSDLPSVILKRFLSLGTPLGLMLLLFIPLAAKMAFSAYRNNIKTLALEKENLQLQHNYLKAQLNPHFLFNSMNNIYGLINSGQNERSADLISRLSQLLRYLLYGSGTEKVDISEEARFISDYTTLEKIRLNDTVVTFTYNAGHEQYRIAPLILIPLVENAFKFVSDNTTSFLAISLEVNPGQLVFSVANTIDAQKQERTEGGIGLMNLKKRLELYYHDRYEYKTVISGNTYSAYLTIQLT
jgi:sensor histidine kinase YesM